MLCNELLGGGSEDVDLQFNNILSPGSLLWSRGQDCGRIDGRKLRSRSQIVSRAIVCQQRKPRSQAGLGILTATQGTVYCTAGAG